MYFLWSLTTIIVGAWATKSILVGKLIFRRSVLDLPLLLFLLSQVISTYFSINQYTSIFGYYSRINGGLLSTFCYIILYWAYVSNMDRQKTLYAIRYTLFSATLVALWAILEHFGFSPSCLLLKGQLNADCWVQDVQTRVFATLGQPNWLAAWLVALFPLALPAFTKKSDTTLLHRSVEFLLPIIFLWAIIFTKSRSGFLGLAAAIATFIFFHLPNKLLLRLGYLLLIAVSGFFLWQYNFSDCFDLNPNQLATTGGTESCKIRTIVWKGAVDIWKNNPLLGTGPETFAYSYYQHRPQEHNLTSEWELLYNKAHNEYLNYLANTGLAGLITYLILIASALKMMWEIRSWNIDNEVGNVKKSNISLQNPASHFLLLTSLLAGYASILVTNFFGFSISVVNLLFFLYPAMAVTVHSNQHSELRNSKLSFKNGLLLLLILGTMSWALFTLARYWRADTLYANADKYGKQGQYPEAAKEIKDALFMRGDEPLYYNELAEHASYLATEYVAEDTTASAKLAQLAIDSASVATNISPHNLNFLKNQSLVFARLSLIDPTYLILAIPPLEKAVGLASTDPKVHYNLGVLYQRVGEGKKALEMINKALKLKPNYQDAVQALQELQPK